jgi:hypothetical protein
MVAMIPALAAAVANEEAPDRTPVTDRRYADYLRRHGLGDTDALSSRSSTRRGSGNNATLDVVAADLWERLASISIVGRNESRPCFGGVQRFQTDLRWRNNLLFHAYSHGDNGVGPGASHQTGWTGLVADVIRRRHPADPAVSGVIQRLARGEHI